MAPHSRWRAPIGVVLAALAAQLLVPTTAAPAAAADASLSVTPNNYVGGQQITLDGNIGRPGVRRVTLRGTMARPSDPWVNLMSTKTDADGDFRFVILAPSMFGVERKVVGGGNTTNTVELRAKSQDLLLLPEGRPVAGQPFDIRVNTRPGSQHPRTSPLFLKGRPDLPAPAFPDRGLTLQQRAGGSWTTLGTTTTDGAGEGLFEDLTVDQPGTAVFRVIQENYFVDGNRIHAFPSFPTPVDVARTSARPASGKQAGGSSHAAAPASSTATAAAGPTGSVSARSGGGGGKLASRVFDWAPKMYDFAWEYAEGLDSKPARGARLRGRWADSSSGLGRVATHNGGLLIDSQRHWVGSGDAGTTTALLQGNALRYGRWEAKMRLKRMESGARNYRALIELVPARARHRRCGARTITIANVTADDSSARSKVRIGVKSARKPRQWRATRRIAMNQRAANAFGVEVGRRHVSWFYNGRVVGTVRSRAAVPGVPMTLRLRLVGRGQREMNKTQFHSDWQRGYTLKKGRQAKRGSKLRGSRFKGC